MMLRDSESHTADFEGAAWDRDTLDEIGNNAGLTRLPRSLQGGTGSRPGTLGGAG